MKILIDQNISFRIVARIQQAFPNIAHVKSLNLIDENDYKIFKFARQNGFDAILTLDEDFYNILLEYNPPPKVIWLRIGNCSTAHLAQIILNNQTDIQTFLNDTTHDCLEIFN
jgi:predicted nuclease of predicted toxin-antitoxin system